MNRHNFICENAIGQIFCHIAKYNDTKVLLPNFRAVGQTQAELHILKVEKLDACTKPLFTNPVTYIVTAVQWFNMAKPTSCRTLLHAVATLIHR